MVVICNLNLHFSKQNLILRARPICLPQSGSRKGNSGPISSGLTLTGGPALLLEARGMRHVTVRLSVLVVTASEALGAAGVRQSRAPT